MRLEYFQMIDSVVAYDPNAKRIVCRAVVPAESTVFEGHFPGHPIVPGVLLVETMAQAAGHLALALLDYASMPFLSNVKDAKFRNFVGPGAALEVSAAIIQEGSAYIAAKTGIVSNGARIADAEILLRLMPYPTNDFAAVMQREAARIGIAAAARP